MSEQNSDDIHTMWKTSKKIDFINVQDTYQESNQISLTYAMS